ncbi:hypothetical protein DS2_13644 [Catenovulum agarivorans DS-2]|uniref:Solute-binding protein family 3/N-terminal domain-containing protein n=1 Tax=Catenovulum agarivorans DS-2 TaxID=1328313 RepID=W7QMR4_9ALTE|nr:hypothetical protein [Catenovulum agarivorans]EWH09208.1 hypothetical protein DS2_13644 [Catenovulum agarivorans DS-2]
MLKSVLTLVAMLSTFTASANTTYTLQASYEHKTQDSYEYQALKLALDKTTADYGPYKLKVTDEPVPPSRFIIEANAQSKENFIFVDSVNKEYVEQLSHANFPVLLGIIGYRIPLVSSDLKSRGYTISSREELMTYSMIQGKGWLDTDILKDNGFKVHTGKYIEGLFHMVAAERGNFFPIGASQITTAIQNFKHVEGLSIDDKILLYYPLPRFYFMGNKNIGKMARVEYGLKLAYEDGSLQKLWQQHFLQAIASVNMEQRKLFKFNNKYIRNIDRSYEQYIYNPFKNN